MSVLTASRRGRLAGAIMPALALGIAGIVVAQSGAQASPRTPALHAGQKIALGSTKDIARNTFAEAPNSAVYYSRGAVVYVVSGNSAPRKVLHAGGTVLAIAASASDLGWREDRRAHVRRPPGRQQLQRQDGWLGFVEAGSRELRGTMTLQRIS